MKDETQIALVTGSSHGISFEVVRQLAQKGITVILTARDNEKGQAAVTQLSDEGLNVHVMQLDVSSGAGSHGDTVFGLTFNQNMGPSYSVSKAALNALTVKIAIKLKDTGILVNAVCPGFTATAPGMEAMGARPVSEGAAGLVWAATLPDDGPTGGFFRDGKPYLGKGA